MIVIGISGKKGHGKDTFADYLVDKYGFKKYTFGNLLKKTIKILFSMSDEQLYGEKKEDVDDFWGYSSRQLLQIIGTDLLRNQFDENIFTKSLYKKIIEDDYKKIVISDVRFENEKNMVESIGGIIYRINRNTIKNNDNHISEKALDHIEFKTIENNSTIGELYKKIDNIIKDYA